MLEAVDHAGAFLQFSLCSFSSLSLSHHL